MFLLYFKKAPATCYCTGYHVGLLLLTFIHSLMQYEIKYSIEKIKHLAHWLAELFLASATKLTIVTTVNLPLFVSIPFLSPIFPIIIELLQSPHLGSGSCPSPCPQEPSSPSSSFFQSVSFSFLNLQLPSLHPPSLPPPHSFL